MIKLEDQVVSLDYAILFNKLGLNNNSLFFWIAERADPIKKDEVLFTIKKDEFFRIEYIDYFNNLPDSEINIHETHIIYPAYTSAEIDELLPDFLPPESGSGTHSFLEYEKQNPLHYIGYKNYNKYSRRYRFVGCSAKSVNARAILLLQLIENKIIEINT